MKKKNIYILLILCICVIIVAFIKRMNFIPASNNLWTDNDSVSSTNDIVDQDWKISEFNIQDEHFKLIDVIYTNSISGMDFPILSLIDESVVMDGDTIISNHYFVKVTYQITNKSDKEASHCMNSFRMNFFENGVDIGLPKEFSSNSINVGMSSDRSYMITNMHAKEIKEITIGMILPKNYFQKYQFVLSYNPTGSQVPRNEENEMIMNESFRLIELDSFLKGDAVNV